MGPVCIVVLALAQTGGFAPHPSGPRQPTARCIVCGVDITGSYPWVAQAFSEAEQAVSRGRAGDIWHFWKITRRSYSDRAHLLTARFPALDEQATNPFSTRRRATALSVQRIRNEASRFLKEYRPRIVRGTDVYGFLARASELLSEAPPGAAKYLILWSDLGDTEHLAGNIDLRGTTVIVVFTGGPDSSRAQRARAEWESKFRGYRASNVIWRDRAQGVLDLLQ